MPRGRPASLQQLLDLTIGESMEFRSEPGDTVVALAKRLRQNTYNYLRQGKAFRLIEYADHVTATSVPVGSHHKLSIYRDLKTGERHFEGSNLTFKERKALLARLDRLENGYWQAEVEPDGIYTRRIYTPGEPLTWWEQGNSEGRLLTLARD